MPTTTANGISVGTRRTTHADDTFRYTGVIRHNGQTIADCGHHHTNRDQPGYRTPSARTCAERLLDGARKQRIADRYATDYRNSWQAAARLGSGTRRNIEQAKAAAAARADAYLAAVATVRALLDPADVDLRTEDEVLAPYRLPLI